MIPDIEEGDGINAVNVDNAVRSLSTKEMGKHMEVGAYQRKE